MEMSVVSSIATSAGFFAAFLFVSAAAWISWRTRTTHVLANRVWRWFTDRQEVSDVQIREFVQEQNDLMSFSFVAGLSAASVEEAHRLIGTFKRLGVDVADVRTARGRIEKTELGIRVRPLPHRATLAVEFLFAGFVALMGLVSVLGMASDSVLVKFGEGDWLVLDATRAKPFTHGGAALTPTQCDTAPLSSSFRMKAEDIDNVCAAWKDSRIGEYLATTLQDQRRAFGWLAGVSFLIAIVIAWDVRTGAAARRVHRALQAHGLADGKKPSARRVLLRLLRAQWAACRR